jgi:hypothetical protein
VIQAPTSDESGPDRDPPPARPVPLSRWSRCLFALISLVIAATAGTQLATMFLAAAPGNALSTRYHGVVSGWTEPWLQQNWQLFAPDPQTSNITIMARGRTQSGTIGPWVDLTAQDYAAIQDDPFPSQANQNELRRAWTAYTAAVPVDGVPSTPEAKLLQQYVANIAAQRLTRTTAGPYQAVQLQEIDLPITPPDGSPVPNAGTIKRTTPWLAP